jgi:hypothetical protein
MVIFNSYVKLPEGIFAMFKSPISSYIDRCSNPIAVRCCPHIALELCGWIRVGVELVMLVWRAAVGSGGRWTWKAE